MRQKLDCQKILNCCHKNTSSRVQIIRLIDSFIGLERVLYPGVSLEFQASHDDVLEVHDSTCLTALLAERIACIHLAI